VTPPLRLAVVCLGNICRSPIADVVLNAEVERRGLGDRIAVESAGTAGYHVGDPMDRRAAKALAQAGYDPSQHRARRFEADWFDRLDLVLAMDVTNHTDLSGLARAHAATTPIRYFREFDPAANGELDVRDPYYGTASDFEATVLLAERTAADLVTQLLEK
jgi:protein-tyrosine phosphatase